jgi:hypothetical protein
MEKDKDKLMEIEKYKLPYFNLTNFESNEKVWYKMKGGYICQYSYNNNDETNYVTKRRFQYYGMKMDKLKSLKENDK